MRAILAAFAVWVMGMAAAAAQPLTKMTIATGVDPAFSQFYVAKEGGLFEKNGLDVTINTAAGVSAVAPNKIRAARSLGASPAQVFFYVALPATMPYILTGMRLAMANSFVTIIAAELVAANNGLGRMIWDSRMYMLVDQIFVALVVLGFLGFTADRLFRWGIYAFAGRFSPVT